MLEVLVAPVAEGHLVHGVDAAGARRHQHHAAAEVDGLFHVVRDEDDGGLLQPVHVADQVVHHLAGLRVQRAEGLVHQQDAGAAHERARNGHALLHAARELVGPGIGRSLQAHEAQQRVGPARGGLHIGRGAVLGVRGQLAAELDVLHHRHPRVEAVVLEHHGAVDVRALDRLAVHQQFPAGVRLQPADGAQQRALAAARGTDEGDELVGRDVEVDVFQRVQRRAVEALEQLADADLGRRGGWRVHGDQPFRYSQGKALRCAKRNSWSVSSPMRPMTMIPAKMVSVCRKRCARRMA